MYYEVKGKVVDLSAGVAGVRVEAWDKDPGADDYLGSAGLWRRLWIWVRSYND